MALIFDVAAALAPLALHALARIRPALFRALAAGPVTQALAHVPGDASARLIGDIEALEDLIVRRPTRPASSGAPCRTSRS